MSASAQLSWLVHHHVVAAKAVLFQCVLEGGHVAETIGNKYDHATAFEPAG